MGKNRPHVVTMIALRNWLITLFGEQYVETETPIDVAPEDNPTNESEPDIIVLTKTFREFAEHNPQPTDLRLVVEISDSTLGFDLKTKAALYQSVTVYRSDESVAPLAAPQSEFRVGDAFPG